MLEKQTFDQMETTDLRMVNCGIEDCVPSYKWGPGIRSHYIIHLVLSGNGVYFTHGIPYPISENQGFLISPGEVIEYCADKLTPWSYAWIGFDGIHSKSLLYQANIDAKRPVFAINNITRLISYIHSMLNCVHRDLGRDEMLLGLLYQFISELIRQNGSKEHKTKQSFQEEYIRKCIMYIADHYSNSLNVKELSTFVGLDRSYLYSLFMRYLRISPKEYITQFRMKKATELLHTGLNIQEIARSVGYEDALLFSKNFKRQNGLSPSQYRRKNFV
jgi:AraC-like DNA-binding protein